MTTTTSSRAPGSCGRRPANARTAIRGGWGLYVDRSFLNVQLDVAAAQNSDTIVIQNPGYPDPFSRGTLGTVTPSKTVIAPNPRAPQTQNVSLGFQRELRTGLSLSLDGVYSRGTNQFNNRDLNYPLFPGGPRPDPSIGRIIMFGMEGNSWSTALLGSLQYRPRRGPSLGLSYTLSKSLRDVEDFQYFAQDELNPAADKGPASNDRRHQVVANFNWSVPGGVQVAGLASTRTGLPWNVTTGVDSNLDTQINDRPDLLVPGGEPLSKSTYDANFTRRVGNLPRNYNPRTEVFLPRHAVVQASRAAADESRALRRGVQRDQLRQSRRAGRQFALRDVRAIDGARHRRSAAAGRAGVPCELLIAD